MSTDDNGHEDRRLPETHRQEKHAQEVARLDRRARAVELRANGLTYKQVGEALGVNPASAHKLIHRQLNRDTHANVDELRARENTKLDELEQAIWGQCLAGDLPAVQTWLKLAARRARLNGLDAPIRLEASVEARDKLTAALDDLERLLLGGPE